GVNAVQAAILTKARPRDDKVAVGLHGHGGIPLVAHHGRVDTEVVALGLTPLVEAPGIHAPAVAVLAVARPGDDKFAVSIHGCGRLLLVTTRRAVDAELSTQRYAASVIELSVDAIAAAGLHRGPSNYKVAVLAHAHRRVHLVVGSGRVHLKGTAHRQAMRVI